MTKKDEELFAIPPKPVFKDVLKALLNNDAPFPPKFLHQFSDLSEENLAAFKEVWPKVTDQRRQAILEDLEELADSDTLLSFEEIGRFAVTDPLAPVRVLALRLLWESVDTRIVPLLINLLKKDPDYHVRAAAASNLGMFVYYGELEEISESLFHKVENALLETLKGNDHFEVRRRALEAMGFSSRDEMADLIEIAYQEKDHLWLVSALFAMGRSANEKWQKMVAAHLNHSDPAVQLEAVRAAGELSQKDAREDILELLEDEELDSDVWEAAVWSLSQIGGGNVRDTLESMAEENDDDEEVEILENALENLSFTEDMEKFELLDVDDMDDEMIDEMVDDMDDSDSDESEKVKTRNSGKTSKKK
jgi:hypothetical protein